jgi:hypothetical protein
VWWFLVAVAGLFNAVVNDGAAHTLSTDIRLLLKNVFRCLGCVDRVEAIELDEQRELEEQTRVNDKIKTVAASQVSGTSFLLRKVPLAAATVLLFCLGNGMTLMGIIGETTYTPGDDGEVIVKSMGVVGRISCLVVGVGSYAACVWLVRKKILPAWKEYKSLVLPQSSSDS